MRRTITGTRGLKGATRPSMADAMARCWRAAALLLFTTTGTQAADLVWKVEHPVRLYKSEQSFRLHEQAFLAVRGEEDAPIPHDIVERTERCLNDARSAGSAAAPCAAQARSRTGQLDEQLGWAAHTIDDICYEQGARPRRYPDICERTFAFQTQPVRENYILPESHAVRVGLSPELLAEFGGANCMWRWIPRAGGNAAERTRRCDQGLVIARVPYSSDAASGMVVEVLLPGGRAVSETIVVDDVLIVALGDSFSSGEGNPDRPVSWSAARAMDYRLPMPEAATASMDGRGKGRVRRAPIALDARRYDPFVLPKRLMEDEEEGLQYDPRTEKFRQAFWARSAAWVSPDCHRSQYAYPFRVAMQLAVEDRHRAVTLVHLSCSGADVVNGLFGVLDAREHHDPNPRKTKAVPAQLDQLTALLCRSAARSSPQAYTLPTYEPGDPRVADRTMTKQWCPPHLRKRDVDLLLLSVGGNDVGFSALAAYAFLESAGDIATIARLRESRLRFGPELAETYLHHLDARFSAVQRALKEGFGVPPERVVQTSYEALQFDEGGRLCGVEPGSGRLGMDVHAKFALAPDRMGAVGRFYDRFLKRLECISGRDAACASANRTGFHLVSEHQAAFRSRGVCARDPGDDGSAMQMPRIPIGQTDFAPTSPGDFRPYMMRTRLFRTPNDAFLAANTHANPPVPLFDILQPAVAALYGGAFHPTAQAHAIVADHVLPYARRVVNGGR